MIHQKRLYIWHQLSSCVTLLAPHHILNHLQDLTDYIKSSKGSRSQLHVWSSDPQFYLSTFTLLKLLLSTPWSKLKKKGDWAFFCSSSFPIRKTLSTPSDPLTLWTVSSSFNRNTCFAKNMQNSLETMYGSFFFLFDVLYVILNCVFCTSICPVAYIFMHALYSWSICLWSSCFKSTI